MTKKFNELNIDPVILKAIEGLGYSNLSKVQEKVIPEVLYNKDVLVKSQTGSGKTAAFVIPVCEKIDWEESSPQVLVLTPTRELALQVSQEFFNIGRFKRIKSVSVFGKYPISEQIRLLKQKTHVVVGTPGRVLDHIDRKSLDLKKIKYLVIDEADELLNMGFIKQVELILNKLPKRRVSMLFSATIPEDIKKLCQKHLNKPVEITIDGQTPITENINHILYYIKYDEKFKSLNDVLICEMPETAIIFCSTKESVNSVNEYLQSKSYSVNKIHGGMLQKDRLDVMQKFKQGNFRILVATDVAARGIDILGITHVINFDLPVEKEAYVHRIGRTGRAGAKGKAISFSVKQNSKLLKNIEDFIGHDIPVKDFPSIEEIKEKKDKAIRLLKSKPQKKENKDKKIALSITKIYLNGGKKKKIRAGDIVGSVCKIQGITSDDIGIIDVQENVSYVEILNGKGNDVIRALKEMTIKGKKIKVEIAKK